MEGFALNFVSGCIASLLANNADRSILDAVRRLSAGGVPENHDVLKAMHVSFLGALRQMAKAIDAVGGTAADNFSRRALAGMLNDKALKKLDLTAPQIPAEAIEAQINLVTAAANADAVRRAATDAVIALIQQHTADALSPAHVAVFHEGHGRYLCWADYFDLFWAEQIKTDGRMRAYMVESRLREITALLRESPALADDVREALDQIRDEIADLREEVREGNAAILAALAEVRSSEGGPIPAAALQTLRRAVDEDKLTQTERSELLAIVERLFERAEPEAKDRIRTFFDNVTKEGSDEFLSTALRELAGEARAALIAERKQAILEDVKAKAAELRLLASYAAIETPSEALELYRQATQLDPTDLWSWIELGRLRMAYDGLAAARQCFEAALQYVAGERDRSVLHTEFGNVLMAEGQLGEARREYTAALAIDEALAQRETGNAAQDVQRQRDLAVSYERLGEVETAAGNLAAARERFTASLAIREALAQREPGNAQWQRDLWVSLWRLANLGHPDFAWTRVLAQLEAMEAAGTLLPTDRKFLEDAREKVQGAS